jgi:tungstate transport system ATP-binding protein
MPENIEYSGLCKQLGGRNLFRNLQLHIGPGECLLLSGYNGQGKTTLLRIMAGLTRHDSGYCRYDGKLHDLTHAKSWMLRNVVYLHQEPYMFDASVQDNITYGLRRRRVRVKPARQIAQDALQRAGLSHLAQRSARQLSGGERQRVALLRAWVLSPRLLFLDEPTASMDEGARHCTLFLVRWLLQDGVGIIITAHEPRFFAPLADRHLRLNDGGLFPVPLQPAVPAIALASDSVSNPENQHDGQRQHT